MIITALNRFWAETWPWLLLLLALVLSLQALCIIVVSAMPWASTNQYKIGRIERFLTQFPSWFQSLAGPPLPHIPGAGIALARLERQYSKGLRAADRANRTLLAIPMTLSGIALAIGLLQALDTFVGLAGAAPKIYSWELLSFAVLALTISAYLASVWLRDFRWTRRLPFEWAYLDAAAWAVKSAHGRKPRSSHHVQASDSVTTAQYLDAAETVLVHRFATAKRSRLPSTHLAEARWAALIEPLIAEKADILLETGIHQPTPAILRWLDLGAQRILDTSTPPQPQLPPAPVARAGTPRSPNGQILRITLLFASISIIFWALFALLQNQEHGISPNFALIINAASPWLATIEAIAAVVGVIVAVHQSVRARES